MEAKVSYEECIICEGYLGACNCILGDMLDEVFELVYHG